MRISVGRFNTDEQIDRAVDRIVMAVRELQQLRAVITG
jgi:cysteine sulfinate desulfinase/cysteine desulfurase-like protein